MRASFLSLVILFLACLIFDHNYHTHRTIGKLRTTRWVINPVALSKSQRAARLTSISRCTQETLYGFYDLSLVKETSLSRASYTGLGRRDV
jgi:hypothetical protein